MLDIKSFVGAGFAENAYLVRRRGSDIGVAVDPGANASEIISVLQQESISLAAILLTHAHIDHIEGVAVLKRHATAPLYLHLGDQIFYDNAAAQAAQFGIRVEKLPAVDQHLHHGQQLVLADITFDVRHTPGHSPGHVIFYVPASNVAFVGDVVFQASIGRTDLPGGSYVQLMQSIRDQVMRLPDETVLYSGHGPLTTVREERVNNPFIAPMYGGSFA